MVTRNRKFSTPYGYSRRTGKRDAERLIAEELETEPASRMPRTDGAGPQPNPHVALQLEPRVMPRGGIDLRAVTRETARREQVPLSAAAVPLHPLLRLARQIGRRLLHLAQRQGQRLLRWISWR